MSEANPERGEHELVLAGTAYRLRPSFTAIVAIEKKTDRSLLALTRDAASGDLSLTQIGLVAAELIRAGAEDDLTKRVSAEQIATLAYENGVPSVLPVLTMCLLGAANGGRDPLGGSEGARGSTETGKAAAPNDGRCPGRLRLVGRSVLDGDQPRVLVDARGSPRGK